MQPSPAPHEPSHVPSDSIDARINALGHSVGLSTRERAVLRLIALGYRYREIASVIAISPRTVKMGSHATGARSMIRFAAVGGLVMMAALGRPAPTDSCGSHCGDCLADCTESCEETCVGDCVRPCRSQCVSECDQCETFCRARLELGSAAAAGAGSVSSPPPRAAGPRRLRVRLGPASRVRPRRR
jgi:hypothetical protein